MGRWRTPALFIVMACAQVARADYILSPLSMGESSRTATPGESFSLDMVLSASAGEEHNSAIFRVTFSAPGLWYEGYEWHSSYGMVFDDSVPAAALLPLELESGTLMGPGYPDGVVDIELSNVAPIGFFGEGALVSLNLRVPLDYAGPETITIQVEPDTFANGFDELVVIPGESFVLTIPSPQGGVVLSLAVLWTGMGLRRRRGAL